LCRETLFRPRFKKQCFFVHSEQQRLSKRQVQLTIDRYDMMRPSIDRAGHISSWYRGLTSSQRVGMQAATQVKKAVINGTANPLITQRVVQAERGILSRSAYTSQSAHSGRKDYHESSSARQVTCLSTWTIANLTHPKAGLSSFFNHFSVDFHEQRTVLAGSSSKTASRPVKMVFPQLQPRFPQTRRILPRIRATL
jgi:hypothetical protein